MNWIKGGLMIVAALLATGAIVNAKKLRKKNQDLGRSGAEAA